MVRRRVDDCEFAGDETCALCGFFGWKVSQNWCSLRSRRRLKDPQGAITPAKMVLGRLLCVCVFQVRWARSVNMLENRYILIYIYIGDHVFGLMCWALDLFAPTKS